MQIRKLKGFRVLQNVNVLSHTQLCPGHPKGHNIFPSAVSHTRILVLWFPFSAKQLKGL